MADNRMLELGKACGTRLMDFIANDGYKFEKNELVELFKEYVYTVEEHISKNLSSDNAKAEIEELGKEFLVDLKENTDLFED